MTDSVTLTAASDLVIGLVVAVPVLLVAGGVALARRGRDGGDEPSTGGGTAVAERPAPAAPTPTATPEAPATGAPAAGAPTAAPEAPAPAPPAPEPASYRGRLGKARGLLSGYVGAIRARGKIDASTWDELEEALIRADVGVGATDALLDDLRGRVQSGEIGGPDALVDALKTDLVTMLQAGASGLPAIGADRPSTPDGEPDRTVDVWLFVGVNGVGKTTTVGKVATRLTRSGTPVLLAAGDTFRAAAGEQLSLGPSGRGPTSCAGPRAATRRRWCSTPSSGPPRRGTPWCWPTRPAGSTTR